jgi:diacylglycerol kinase family enzyme
MKRRTALLIINPRLGEKITQLKDMMAVFAAAGWKTEVALKEFGNTRLQLAKAGSEAGYDLVIGCGGDGTLNQIVNGVMASKSRHSIVGVIPTGTANVWAREIGLPEDPVAACLSLVNSEARKVDLGHVEVEALAIPSRDNGQPQAVRSAAGGVHHFLLMAGLGIDAALMRRASTTLKQKLGATAVAISAVKGADFPEAVPDRDSVIGKRARKRTPLEGRGAAGSSSATRADTGTSARRRRRPTSTTECWTSW